MQVTLKQAHDLQLRAIATASKIEVQNTVALSTYVTEPAASYVTRKFDDASAKVDAAIEDALALFAAGFEIRRMRGECNAVVPDGGKSHNDLLSQRALAEVLEKHLLALRAGLMPDEGRYGVAAQDEAVARIEHAQKSRDTPELTRHVNRDLSISAVTEAQCERLDNEIATLRQRKSDLTARLDYNNLSTRIDLPDFVVKTLRQAKIIVGG